MPTNTPDVNFRISVLSKEPVPIPTERFSVRQNSAIWCDGYYYLYADVIPWDNPYHPDSYDTSIHLFKSANAENWEYHGEVIGKGKPGEWTANGERRTANGERRWNSGGVCIQRKDIRGLQCQGQSRRFGPPFPWDFRSG